MKRSIIFCFLVSLLATSFAYSQPTAVSTYQGITVPASYSYHLAGRTDRVHGYVMKIDDANQVSSPGLVFLASGIDENEGYVEVNGEKYTLPALMGALSKQVDKSAKNAEGKEGWYSFSSGDDIIGKIVIPLNAAILKSGLNDVSFYKNPDGDGFEIIDVRIESVTETAPTVIGQTYHLLARGKPSAIR